MPRKPYTKKPTRKVDIEAAADRAEARAAGKEPKTAKVPVDPPIIKAEEIVEEFKAKMGRPTKYRPEYARIAAALCRRGATDFELAEEFEVSTSTIWRWSCTHDEFWQALHVEKAGFDRRVERSLAQRATGYSYHTERVFQFQGEIIRARVVEHVPADIGAAKLWLTNRDPANWREATQRVEHGAPGDFDGMSNDELEAYIEAEAKALSETKVAVKRSKTTH